MKWFKHFTDSLDDPFIQELLDEFSHAGYVAFFGLIEIIAKENGHKVTGDLEISPAYLKRKLRISQAKLKQIFGFCSTKGKLFSDFSKEKWKFNFPKIAELKDNYTKDLQVACKKPSKHKEVEEEEEVDKKKKKTPPPDNFIPSTNLSKFFSKEWYWQENKENMIAACFDNFRSKGEKKIDWEAIIRNWFRKDKEWYPQKYIRAPELEIIDSSKF